MLKACLPKAFITQAQVHPSGRLSCTFSFESGNGPPEAAMLIPMCQNPAGAWGVPTHHGWTPHPCAADLRTQPVRLSVTPQSDTFASLQDAPWPAGHQSVLLLLLHDQVSCLGTELLNRQLEVRMPIQGPLLAAGQAANHAAAPPPGRVCEQEAAQAVAEFFAGLSHGWIESGSLLLAMVHRRESPPTPPTAPTAPGACTTTAPRPSGIAFALASCQYPAGLVDGGIRSVMDRRALGPSERSLWQVAEHFKRDPSLRFSVMTGDQVYVDATAGLFDPASLAGGLQFAYNCMHANKGLQSLLHVSGDGIFAMHDDHEIQDNWEPLPQRTPANRVQNDMQHRRLRPSIEKYLSHQRILWPRGFVAPTEQPQALWRQGQIDGHDFFFADTRTEREGRHALNLHTARIMHSAQGAALRHWIRRRGGAAGAEQPPGFIVSPAILLPRKLAAAREPAMALHDDSWTGYPRSLHAVLTWLYEYDAKGVVFLSGDEHLSCVAHITIERPPHPRQVRFHSVHSSALYAPYPFANAMAQDFAQRERFSFQARTGLRTQLGEFTCTVSTWFPPAGDGYAVLKTRRGEQAWWLDMEFVRGETGASTRLRRKLY